MSKLNYIDIFAGCGGLSLGLHQAGWNGLFAIEKSPMAFETLKHNLIDKKNHFLWPNWLPQKAHDVNLLISEYGSELSKLKGKVNLVAGGPPCQGFSFAGKRNEKDQRNKLVNAYIKFVKIIEPEILLFENVKGFTSSFKSDKVKQKNYSNLVVNKLKKLGYNVHAKIINFGEFGVPQNRKRFILVGVKNGESRNFFDLIVNKKKSFLKQKNISSNTSVKEAISDLLKKNGLITSEEFRNFKIGKYGGPNSNFQNLMRENNVGLLPDSHRFSNHSEKTIFRFNYILNSCKRNNNVSKELKKEFNTNKHTVIALSPDERSPTLTTLPDDYIHYLEPRILTVREYARIQSFPDWFEFKNKYTTGGKNRIHEVPRYSQVGNAIPPLFAELAGNSLKDLIKNNKGGTAS